MATRTARRGSGSAKTETNHHLEALIMFAFLITFVWSRLIVYAVLSGHLPNLFLTIRGVHVHHFTYGVFTLAIVGMILLLLRPKPNGTPFKILTILYGVGIGLTFDEFGMWIHLRDDYWIRQSYDAIIIITLIFLNLLYWKYFLWVFKELFIIILYPFKLIKRLLVK